MPQPSRYYTKVSHPRKKKRPKLNRELALCEEAWQHIEQTGITYTLTEMRAYLK